jgi:septal ring factor EnvC (AmiA/AmiB activator)
MLKKIQIFLLILISINLFAQKQKDRASLEREKKQNLQKIAQTKKILSQTQKEKQNTLGEIKALNSQIENHESKISLAKEDIDLIKTEMVEIEKAKNDLFKQLKSLQKDYAETIYRESKNSKKLSKLGFLFSSGSINELFLRYKYLEQYSESRKQQLGQITKIGEMLKHRQRTLLDKKIAQQNLILEIKEENKNLVVLKEKQTQAVNQLIEKESDLKTELEKSKVALSSLNNMIANAITKDKKERKTNTETSSARSEKAAEIKERERKMLEARKAKSEKTLPTEPEAEVESPKSTRSFKNFAASKSHLRWPVDGFISDRFGIKPHPVLKGLKVNNNGIDIQTSPNAPVKAVFEGVVLDISQIPGLNNVVAVQHGDYYTVYANLETVNVRINQEVGASQTLGKAAYKDGSPEINFQIWHNFDKLNPEPWLGSK